MKEIKTKTIILSFILVVALCACGSSQNATDETSAVSPSAEIPPTPETTATPTATPAASPEAAAPDDGTDTLNAIGDIDVDPGLFNVTIIIPAEFVGETTQAELDASLGESDFTSATLNDDGSVTYTLPKNKHEELMREYQDQINQSLSDMIQFEDYPSFTSIETNDDFTEFNVYMNTDKLGLTESFSVLGFYMYGGLYNHFNGTPVDNVRVLFINEETGEVVSESNSKDMD